MPSGGRRNSAVRRLAEVMDSLQGRRSTRPSPVLRTPLTCRAMMTLPPRTDSGKNCRRSFAYDATSPLIFSSGLFLFLFAGFLLIYSAFRRAPMARIVYVVLFSLYFYYKSSGIYFLLLIFAAASDFLIARGIYHTERRRTKRWLVALSVAVNLGMLGYFKYTNFLIDISNQLFGQGFLQFQNIFLPVGISFFVFQSMSYTIDIYRGQLKPLVQLAGLSLLPVVLSATGGGPDRAGTGLHPADPPESDPHHA